MNDIGGAGVRKNVRERYGELVKQKTACSQEFPAPVYLYLP